MDDINVWTSIAASAIAIIGGVGGFVIWNRARCKSRAESALNDGNDHWLSLQRRDTALTQVVIAAEAGSEAIQTYGTVRI